MAKPGKLEVRISDDEDFYLVLHDSYHTFYRRRVVEERDNTPLSWDEEVIGKLCEHILARDEEYKRDLQKCDEILDKLDTLDRALKST